MNKSLEDRIYASITVNPETECWESSRTPSLRYPRIGIGRKNYLISHVICEIFNMPIPIGMQAQHDCDNPRCVNPFHIKSGIPQDNSNDMKLRNRQARLFGDKNNSRIHRDKLVRGDKHWTRKDSKFIRGENNGNTKITEQQAKEIIAYQQQGCRLTDVINFMKLPKGCVMHVWYGISWKYLPRK